MNRSPLSAIVPILLVCNHRADGEGAALAQRRAGGAFGAREPPLGLSWHPQGRKQANAPNLTRGRFGLGAREFLT